MNCFVKIFLIGITTLILSALFTSCHCPHDDEPAPQFKVGHVLCTDGEIMPFCQYINSDKEAIGIVFYVNSDPDIEGRGYAVYLRDLDGYSFAADLGYEQGTSSDISAFDGNQNTYAMYSSGNGVSPLARAVFDLWKYGQSAYIPSVSQYKLLTAQKEFLNERIVALGGDALPDDADNCWYWTSTEVDGQEQDKAWLFSMHSGSIQETPKNQPHKARPIITIL